MLLGSGREKNYGVCDSVLGTSEYALTAIFKRM